AEDGWQYAQSFDTPDELWTAEKPPQLERLLGGNGVVAAGLSPGPRSNGRGRSLSGSSSSAPVNSQKWVRRRRWVRVMRRRLDIPPLPFLEPDGAMYHLSDDGTLIPYIDESIGFVDEGYGEELTEMPSSMLSGARDYVSRARYLVGNQSRDETNGTAVSALEARRAIAKLERATTELRQGILSDDDADRKTQAEVLLNTYSRELERRRLAAGAQGLLISGDGDAFPSPLSSSLTSDANTYVSADDDLDIDGDSSDEEFHYPGSSPSRGPTDLTPHLSQAPEFRVPTHEAPQKVMTPRWTAPTPHQVHAQWERDETVQEALLDPSDVVQDPAFPDGASHPTSHLPPGLRGSRTTSMERIVIDQGRLSVPTHLTRAQSSSQLSDLADCPVCNEILADLGSPAQQEAHVKNCLDGGSGTTPQSAKYLVYKLPPESALIGIECTCFQSIFISCFYHLMGTFIIGVICLEEFAKGKASRTLQ
ncbi:hypothetical protein PLICRDRAFT_96167, partial [Plicaturopsis crispa FD-325 SS-3]